jgi:hypothetical protein
MEIGNSELQSFIDHIPGVENIPADAFLRLVRPHVSKTSALKVITEEEMVPVQLRSVKKHGAADIALRSALEEGPMDTDRGSSCTSEINGGPRCGYSLAKWFFRTFWGK